MGDRNIVYPRESRFLRCQCEDLVLFRGRPQVADDRIHFADRKCMPIPEVSLTHEEVREIDRNARAYGWEIGNGHPIVEVLDKLTPNNPFLDPQWARGIPRRSDG